MWAFLKWLLPVKWGVTVDDVEAEVAKIEAKAKAEVEALRASHAVQSIETQIASDAARAKAVFEHYLTLIHQQAPVGTVVAVEPTKGAAVEPVKVAVPVA